MERNDSQQTREAFQRCYDFMQANYGDPVFGQDFYEYIFPDNEKQSEQSKEFSKPNALYLYQPNPESKKMKRRIMFKDTWENDYIEYVADNIFTLCGGLSYIGRVNKLALAQNMNALVFDIDGVGLAQLRTIIARTEIGAEQIRSIPLPTYIVLSGAGVHLYYVFDNPVPLYPNIKLQMKNLKYALTFRIWDYGGTTTVKKIQYQSINQGFRMVGSINDKYGTNVTAFKVGDRVSLDYLNQYVKPESRVDIAKPFRPTQLSREEAAEKFPEWYQKVVVNGDHRPQKWDIAGKVHGDDPYALYHWWLRQIDKVVGGHRYFFMMNLAIYACKCDVPEDMLNEDLDRVFEVLRKIPHTNDYGDPDELDKQDIIVAKEAYSKEYYGFKLEDHIKTSGIEVERNRRNGRKQAEHVKRITALRDLDYPDGSWRNKGGRPVGSGTAMEKVLKWRAAHPDGKKIDCHRETGLSRVTIDKWWDTDIEKEMQQHMLSSDYFETYLSSAPTDPEVEKRTQRLTAYYEGFLKYYGKKIPDEEEKNET